MDFPTSSGPNRAPHAAAFNHLYLRSAWFWKKRHRQIQPSCAAFFDLDEEIQNEAAIRWPKFSHNRGTAFRVLEHQELEICRAAGKACGTGRRRTADAGRTPAG
jgi:hypothetical protein